MQVVMCHGFTNHTARTPFVRMMRVAAGYGQVHAFDFRGHGSSAGGTSVGGDGEVADLDAVVSDVRREHPSAPIVTIGFSMGGSVAIRQAAFGQHRPDVVVAISPVSRWHTRDTPQMRRLHWLLESKLGPRIAPLLVGTRLGGPWAQTPRPPIDAAAHLADRPLLLVHGTADRYFGVEHSRALHAAAGPGSTLWIEPGFGHAESGMTPPLLHRILRWVRARAGEISAESTAVSGE